MAAADSACSSSGCPLCGGELLFTKTLDDESDVVDYNKLLAHVRGEGLPEDHQNRAAWAYADARGAGADEGSCGIAAVVKEVRVGSTVCRICYRADVEGTIAAWRDHGCCDSDIAVLQTLPRYWTLVVEAAKVAASQQGIEGNGVSMPTPTSSRSFNVQKTEEEWKSELGEAEYKVLRGKCTEAAGTGEYDKFYPEIGYFVCKACRNPLYSAGAKFNSGCGWPAFDKCFKGSVTIEEDNQFGRRRVEIMCGNCGGHLGHVFDGEQMTDTNERHCVNSTSVKFVNEPVPEGYAEETVA